MQSKATNPEQYIAELPGDRHEAMKAMRRCILDNLPEGYQEVMQWGMISYIVPLSIYPDTYNKQALGYISLANQKNYMTLYLLGVYADSDLEKQLRAGYEKVEKRLDFGKSCLRFTSLDDVLFDVIGPLIAAIPMDEHIARTKEAHKKL